MRNGLKALPLILVSIAPLTGCVGQGKYDDTADTARTFEQRIAALTQNNRNLESSNERLTNRISQLESENASLRDKNSGLTTRISDTRSQLNDIANRVNSLDLSFVDPDTDAELRKLAADNPNLIRYDSSRAMITFTGDLTFPSGSANVTDSAKSSLNILAKVLNKDSIARYEIRVVGHTDSQTISNDATRRRFGDNRGLSLARAKSVSEALQSFGVDQRRIEVSGWGQWRPIVANNAKGGTPQNRRVDIVIQKPMDSSMASSSSRPTESRTDVPTSNDNDYPMK